MSIHDFIRGMGFLLWLRAIGRTLYRQIDPLLALLVPYEIFRHPVPESRIYFV